MIGMLLLAFQAAAGPTLTVRTADGVKLVPLFWSASGLSLRPDLLAPAVPTTVRALPNNYYTLSLGGIDIELAEQVPFARIGSSLVPLVAPPYVEGGVLYVPLHVVSELVPRYATNLMFDAERLELRAFPPQTPGSTIFATRPTGPIVGRGVPAPRRIPPRTALKRLNRIVVVDAGHGGPDNGMTGPVVRGRRLYEKDVTLAVARRFGDMLRDEGFTVVMTRDADTLIARADRGRIANERHGDLFVSIHVNAANQGWKNPTGARGFETYFLAEAKTEDAKRLEEMENESVRFETAANAGRDDDLSFLINDMAQNEHLRESSDFAETVQRSLARAHPGPNRGVKQAGFRVLVGAFMPAVLVEVGFGTNPEEASFLADPGGQRTLARALANATIEYMDHYERRVGSGR